MADPAVVATTLEILTSAATVEMPAGSAGLVEVPVAVATVFAEDGPASAVVSISAGIAMSVAEQGPAGAPGPTGGGIEIFQTTPAGTWSFTHDFGRRPGVTVYALDGEELFADVSATSFNVTITHAEPRAGSVILS